MGAVAHTLRAARQVLIDRGWSKEAPAAGQDAALPMLPATFDVMGAVYEAAGCGWTENGDGTWEPFTLNTQLIEQCELALEDVLFDMGLQGLSPVTYNDMYAETVDDVLSLLETAAIRAEEAEAEQ